MTMKKSVLLFLSIICFSTHAQSPGGVSGCEIWSKVTPAATGSTYQYKDFSGKNKAITPVGSLTSAFFNYNYSFTYTSSSYVSYLSKLESLKDATLFIVNLPTPPADPATKYGLISTNWSPTITPQPTGVNEQSFQFSTTNFTRATLSLDYPTITAPRPNGRINTLLWHNFNSKKINNSFGSNGESDIFIGKQFVNASNNALNFVGQIPEFIVYRKALNDKEKWRVESYLALKYGITLQLLVSYFSSRNEEIWKKANNTNFNNRIIGIGRDSNSSLYQRQSTSIHDPASSLILTRGNILLTDNYPTTQVSNEIVDQNFILMGDNNGVQTINLTDPTDVINGIHFMKRRWLVQKNGSYAHLLSTSLRYKPNPAITLANNEAFWLLVDRDATNTTVSNFSGTNVDYYPITTFPSNYAEFKNLNWGNDNQTFNQFTFGVGPRMIVQALPQAMLCNAVSAPVVFNILGGSPSFTVVITGTTTTGSSFNNTSLPSSNHNFTYNIPTGHYQIFVTDSTGFTASKAFEVSATPGIALNLGPDINLIQGQQISLNPGLNVTATNVNYKWYRNGTLIANTSLGGGLIVVGMAGTYKCVITNLNNGCTIEDTVVVTIVQVVTKASSLVTPNPSTGLFKVMVVLPEVSEVSFTLYDVSGKLLSTKSQGGQYEYEQAFELNQAGVYFVKVQAADYSTTHKIIIN
jgi:hypothetical protein